MNDNKSEFSNPFDDDDMKPIEDDTSGRTFVWLILGVAAIGCGLVFAAAFFFFKPDAQSLVGKYFPSPTATFTRTPTVTPSITPSPTSTATPTPNMTAKAAVLQATDTAAAYQATALNAATSGRVILKDAFDSNKNNWVVKQSDDAYSLTTYKIAEGNYTWDATAHKAFIGWVTADPKSVSDFYLSVEVKQSSGPDSADYGVIFREDNNSNFYYFGINEQGQYILYLFNTDWSTLIDWTESELIQPGETNRITVLGEGSHFIFFINDQYLIELTDDSIKSGTTALAIELAGADDNAVFQFDNFELRVPK
ncbi:MAG: family 16 glycoside hydrolase [Chloroflexota bacterium]